MIAENRSVAFLVYVGTTFDVNGNRRKGWVVYNTDGERIDFVQEDASGDGPLLESGYAAFRKMDESIRITEEEWENLSNLASYPASSRKFDNLLAEKLWDLSLSSNQDADLGDSETFGWYALFKGDSAILNTNSQGFVSVSVFESEEEAEKKWEELENEYSEFCGDDEEE
jgi:hypothetical protein